MILTDHHQLHNYSFANTYKRHHSPPTQDTQFLSFKYLTLYSHTNFSIECLHVSSPTLISSIVVLSRQTLLDCMRPLYNYLSKFDVKFLWKNNTNHWSRIYRINLSRVRDLWNWISRITIWCCNRYGLFNFKSIVETVLLYKTVFKIWTMRFKIYDSDRLQHVTMWNFYGRESRSKDLWNIGLPHTRVEARGERPGPKSTKMKT